MDIDYFREKILNNIICGDALESLKKLPSECVHLIITSPPYNLDIKYENHKDNISYESYFEWMNEIWKESKRLLVSGGRLCINFGENKRNDIILPPHIYFTNQCINLGLLYRGTIIWSKSTANNKCAWGSWMSPSNPHIVPSHEYILIFSKDTFKLQKNDEKIDITDKEFVTCTKSIWSITAEKKKKIGHPAPFPKEIPYRLIKFYSYPKNNVLDMFSGSGTTGLVANETNRNFVAIDNSKEYCELALQRFKDNSGFMEETKNGFNVKTNTTKIIQLI